MKSLALKKNRPEETPIRLPFERLALSPAHLRRYRVFAGLALAVFALALVMSMMPGDLSGRQSALVQRLIYRLTGLRLDETVVRKVGHFAEYAALGAFAGLALAQLKRTRWAAAKVVLAGFVAAFLDETLQIFTGRGPAIVDVWIDTLGVAFGLGFVLALNALFFGGEDPRGSAPPQ
ncbi:MAG TPA: VanZ family protein [Candidatus Limnocylindria bacterium]|nr:VanZ family protein [Candidatus Limnocylindria bacterium]